MTVIGTIDSADTQKPANFIRPHTYLKTDSGAVPDCLFEESTIDLGSGVLGKEAATSAEFHQREVSHLWKRVWQIACRENDIPAVGDRIPYDIAGQSVMLVRTAPDIIKAYHNTCQHRGTRLVDKCDNVKRITCPFHAWSWNLDGSINNVPARWDFPGVANAQLALREVRCERWNGFVFINFDKAAQSLKQYIGPDLLRHWNAWPRTRERKVYHYAKIIPCNWKMVLASFSEVYHVVGTHAQSLPFTADVNAQYDIYGLHSRFISTSATPSAHMAEATDPQEIVDSFITSFDPDAYPEGFPQVKNSAEARKVLADFVRESYRKRSGVDLTSKSDAEMLDSIGYHIFPNSIVWGGYALPVIHRFRPNGNDHRSCFWEFMGLEAVRDDAELQRDAPLVMLAPDEPFADHLGFLGYNLDQDVEILKLLQRGIESDGFDGPLYANYQERNIRNFELNLAKILSEG